LFGWLADMTSDWFISQAHRCKIVIHISKWIRSIIVSSWHLLGWNWISLWRHHLRENVILFLSYGLVLWLLYFYKLLRFDLWGLLEILLLRWNTCLRWSYVLHLGSYGLLHWWLLLESLIIELRLLLLKTTWQWNWIIAVWILVFFHKICSWFVSWKTNFEEVSKIRILLLISIRKATSVTRIGTSTVIKWVWRVIFCSTSTTNLVVLYNTDIKAAWIETKQPCEVALLLGFLFL